MPGIRINVERYQSIQYSYLDENRADDNEEIAIKRYKTNESSSKSVISYYKQRKLLKVINGEAPIEEINIEISGLIEAIKGWL